ncbi:MAG: ABC transporter ATP-binding protein [Pseudomonadota bacterium]
MSAIEFDTVTLGYDNIAAIRNLSATILQGSLTAIVGPNGAGKSTLLRGIEGEIVPLSGRIQCQSTPMHNIAYLPQANTIDRSFPISVEEFVAMGLWQSIGAFGGVSKYDRHQVSDAIHAVGLNGLERRQISRLSGGQMQRVLFARLLLQDASLVLLDEPFTAIDAKTTADLLIIVKRWHEEGRTVVAVLHDHDLVREHFPTTLMIARDLVEHGKTADVMTAENFMRARQMCEACDSPPEACDHKGIVAA